MKPLRLSIPLWELNWLLRNCMHFSRWYSLNSRGKHFKRICNHRSWLDGEYRVYLTLYFYVFWSIKKHSIFSSIVCIVILVSKGSAGSSSDQVSKYWDIQIVNVAYYLIYPFTFYLSKSLYFLFFVISK